MPRSNQQRNHKLYALEGFHPAFAALYFIAVIGLLMFTLNPVVAAAGCVAGIAYNGYLKGAAATLRSLAWQVPLLLIVAVLNPVFAPMGTTELFRVGSFAFYGESLAYGATMGAVLVCVMQWFGVAATVLTSDKIMLLCGPVAPVMGLLITMTMRLVPQFVRRGHAIGDTRAACTAAGGDTASLAERLRQVTVLMAWGMEDSLETSDAMRAKGWGAAEKRTSYARSQVRGYDIMACGLLASLVVLCVICTVQMCASFSFYPVLGPWPTPVLCAPMGILLLVPAVLEWLGE